ncbi:MAG TPA: UbiA family prenyltransferase [Fimbriiglobus sp.]|jgi:4-hydroxybenzoate polyprenyltransferase|nr:UbiA family prenyltransferase [Fimbriiglobus sp.]
MKYPKLLAHAQLLRLPNVFTAFADICLGAAAAGYAPDRPGVFAMLLIASGCLYCAGMAFNDFFDRREDAKVRPYRPIPSGRIAPWQAALIGTLLMACGFVGAGLAGNSLGADALGWSSPGVIALLLIAAILLYDSYLKRTPLGPLGMGACRFLNVLLGLSGAGVELWTWPNLHLAAAVGVYIVGVTWFARTEEGESRRLHLRLASLVMLAGVLLGLTAPAHFAGRTVPIYFPYLVAGFLFLVGLPVVRAIQRPEPKPVQAAVKRAILGLVVLDAVLATAFVGLPGLAILLLLPPAMLLGKWVYST